eukprot:scpid45143/ scgid25102/ 
MSVHPNSTSIAPTMRTMHSTYTCTCLALSQPAVNHYPRSWSGPAGIQCSAGTGRRAETSQDSDDLLDAVSLLLSVVICRSPISVPWCSSVPDFGPLDCSKRLSIGVVPQRGALKNKTSRCAELLNSLNLLLDTKSKLEEPTTVQLVYMCVDTCVDTSV